MDPRDDTTLIDAAGHGDRAAFTRLVERHHRAVIRFIDRFGGLSGRCEDLAQDVFLAAWRAAPRFRPRAKVSTWLLRIAYNACLNERRAGRVRAALSLEVVGAEGLSGQGLEGADGDPEHIAIGRERAERVRVALTTLPERQRAALVLCHEQDLSYAEIARTLGTSRSAVETLLFRARRALRERLERGNLREDAQGLAAPRVAGMWRGPWRGSLG